MKSPNRRKLKTPTEEETYNLMSIARKRRIAITIAAQLRNPTSQQNKVIFRITPEDAHELSKVFTEARTRTKNNALETMKYSRDV